MESEGSMKGLAIIGASGHGKVCADVAELCGYNKIFFLDDDKSKKKCAGYKVEGIVADYRKYLSTSDFFIAVGNTKVRRKITEEIERAGGYFASLVHPNAVISSDVKMGVGSVIMAGTVINSGTRIGKSVIINTSSSVDHDCVIGDYCHVAVGAHLCGTVTLGAETWIGAGAVISNNVDICSNCMIGAGAVAVRDIKEVGVYLGIPAERKKYRSSD